MDGKNNKSGRKRTFNDYNSSKQRDQETLFGNARNEDEDNGSDDDVQGFNDGTGTRPMNERTDQAEEDNYIGDDDVDGEAEPEDAEDLAD